MGRPYGKAVTRPEVEIWFSLMPWMFAVQNLIYEDPSWRDAHSILQGGCRVRRVLRISTDASNPFHAQRGKLIKCVVVSTIRKRMEFLRLMSKRVQFSSLCRRDHLILIAVGNQQWTVDISDLLLVLKAVQDNILRRKEREVYLRQFRNRQVRASSMSPRG